MYVCICNGVTEDDVRGCIAAGASTTRQIKAACGMKPGCGVCTRRLCAMVTEILVTDTVEEEPLSPTAA